MTAQKMATEPRRVQPKVWGQKSKIDEELDYFTELALHESERWIQVQLLHTYLPSLSHGSVLDLVAGCTGN